MKPGDSGSCSDGRQRPWELGEPTDEAPGLDDADSEQVIRVTAERVKECGSGSPGASRWADSILNPPVDPTVKLRQLVRKYSDMASGIGERSYRRPSRRNSDPRMCLPGNVSPVPRITVIVDTSGSMDDKQLGIALGVIRSVLDGFRIRDGIKVITGDESGQTSAVSMDPRKIELRGGGGTDMAKIIGQAMEERVKPQLVIVCTDCWTPWPSEPIGVPLVVCATEPLRNLPTMYAPPEWATVIELTR